jgi:hypothetical protein
MSHLSKSIHRLSFALRILLLVKELESLADAGRTFLIDLVNAGREGKKLPCTELSATPPKRSYSPVDPQDRDTF